jgi:hypothetical protein
MVLRNFTIEKQDQFSNGPIIWNPDFLEQISNDVWTPDHLTLGHFLVTWRPD